MTMAESHVISDDTLDVSRIRPLQDLVLLEDIERKKTSGGIWLADTSNKGTECRMARVVAVGNGIACTKGAFFFPIQLEKGDIVLTMEYAAEKLRLGDGRYRFVRSSFIWAKVTLKAEATYEIKTLHPRFDSYLALPDDETMTRTGTLYIANANNRDSALRVATVMAVGPGRWDSERSTAAKMLRRPMEFGAGEKILMTRYAGAEVEVNGTWMRLIQETDVKSGFSEEGTDGR